MSDIKRAPGYSTGVVDAVRAELAKSPRRYNQIFDALRDRYTRPEISGTLSSLRTRGGCFVWQDEHGKVVGIHTFKDGRNIGNSYRVLGLSDEYVSQCEMLYQSALRGSPRSGSGGFKSKAAA